jgi:pimeloyl-ACP methyl ester carboxylesterase
VQTFNSDGVEIAYLDEGSGDPVLLVHGFASNVATNWVDTGWVKTLTGAGYRVVAYDNRGHGHSEKLYALEDYGAPIMAEDARRLLDHLGIKSAHAMGYSMGARIAAFLAFAHPERVRSLVFGGLGINMVRGVAGTGPVAHALEAASIDEVTNPTARTFRAFAEQTKSDLKALAACIRGSRQVMSRAEVGAITTPALIAVGTKDEVAGDPQALADLMSNARALDIPGRDHNLAVGDKLHKQGVLAFLAERP